MRIANLTPFAIVLAIVLTGCGGGEEEPVPETSPPKKVKKPAAKEKVTEKVAEKKEGPVARPTEKPKREVPPERTFEDLVAIAEAEKEKEIDPLRFALPVVDEAKCRGRGIRKLASKHLTLYTDLPATPAVDELPAVFDLALPQWVAYFQIEPARAEKWHMVGVIAKEKEKFFETGLWPGDLPPFPHGYMRDRQLWVYEQPSDFYRRELLLHEGTHGFMWSFLGGMGPPWYAEGMAELLGTHSWTDGKLTLGVVPPSKESSPMWGRVKVVKDAWSANKALPLGDVLSFPPSAHLKTEAYAWSWAAAVFFDHDPQFQKIFREAPATATDVSQEFSQRLLGRLPQPREQIGEQWQCFVGNLEYGYDVARESIVRKESAALPEAGGTVEVAADRGWQSSGYRLEAGKTYQLTASGRFQIGKSTKPWISEPQGITLKYHKGHPIGMLLAAVTDEGKSTGLTPLATPVAVGPAGEIKVEQPGVLYLRVNDHPAELADNAGTLKVSVGEKR